MARGHRRRDIDDLEAEGIIPLFLGLLRVGGNELNDSVGLLSLIMSHDRDLAERTQDLALGRRLIDLTTGMPKLDDQVVAYHAKREEYIIDGRLVATAEALTRLVVAQQQADAAQKVVTDIAQQMRQHPTA